MNVNTRSLKEIYHKSSEISLPTSYNYHQLAEEEEVFTIIDEKYYDLFPIKHEDSFKMAKLPVFNNFKPILLISYDEVGELILRLFILNSDYKIISNLTLFRIMELGDDDLKSEVYNITKDYSITINERINKKIINSKNYIISKEGMIIEK